MATQAVNPEIIAPEQTEQVAKKRAETRLHDSNGNFAKGNPGGPGRPRTAVLSQAMREMLEKDGAAQYAQAVKRIALRGKREADRLAAITVLGDRTEGKPLQAMLVGHTIDEGSVRAIAELLGKMNIPPMLDSGDE